MVFSDVVVREREMGPRLMMAAQIAAGVIVILIVYAASLWLLQKDALVADPNSMRPPKQVVTIVDGFADMTAAADLVYSTINPSAFNFAALRRSFNRKGGAQFSYSMWLNLKDTSAANVAGKTLMMRGDPRVYGWKTILTDPSTKATTLGNTFSDVLIKCPRIRFGPTFDSLVIEFNTLADPGASVVVSSVAESGPSSDPSLRHNALKLIQGRWALLTFTFEDAVSISDFEDGIRIRFFINDLLFQTSTMASAFKQNSGDLLLLPAITKTDPKTGVKTTEGPIGSAQIGNLAYYNYALGPEDVRSLFRAGPPRKPAALQNGPRGEPLYLSEFNKTEVYNT